MEPPSIATEIWNYDLRKENLVDQLPELGDGWLECLDEEYENWMKKKNEVKENGQIIVGSFFKLLTLVIGYLNTFIGNPVWTEEEMEAMVNLHERASGTHECTTPPGVVCKADTYYDFTTCIRELLPDEFENEDQTQEQIEGRKSMLTAMVKTLDQLLFREQWGCEEKEAIVNNIVDAIEEIKKEKDIKILEIHEIHVSSQWLGLLNCSFLEIHKSPQAPQIHGSTEPGSSPVIS